MYGKDIPVRVRAAFSATLLNETEFLLLQYLFEMLAFPKRLYMLNKKCTVWEISCIKFSICKFRKAAILAALLADDFPKISPPSAHSVETRS